MLGAAVAAACAPAWALYKVVGPDGSVTYTDRPPAAAQPGRVTPLGGGAPARASGSADAAAADAALNALPFELRQVASRYPVTLFTMKDCPACDAGRRWLRERGVPYVERLVESGEDVAALERLVGGRTLPALTVGNTPVRGADTAQWAAYIDAAGYPQGSRLPANWAPPAPRPLAAQRTGDPASAADLPPAPPPLSTRGPAGALPAPPSPAPAPAPGGIRF